MKNRIQTQNPSNEYFIKGSGCGVSIGGRKRGYSKYQNGSGKVNVR